MQNRTWKFSKHAVERAREMGVTLEDMLLVVNDPEVDYQQTKYGATQRLAKRGRLGVPYDDESSTIITVLWNRQDQYKREGK